MLTIAISGLRPATEQLPDSSPSEIQWLDREEIGSFTFEMGLVTKLGFYI